MSKCRKEAVKRMEMLNLPSTVINEFSEKANCIAQKVHTFALWTRNMNKRYVTLNQSIKG